MEIIETAVVDDIAQLADLLTILFTQEADFTPDLHKQMNGLRLILESPQIGRIFVARCNGQIVGMVSLLFTISTAEGAPVCWLEDMVVRPEQRGSGIGSKLLQHAVDYARAHQFARITLLTDSVNADAIRFYQRHGFQLSAMTALRLRT